MSEQRYKAVLAVIADGRTVSEVASDWSVCRRTLHRWLALYEAEGFEGLSDGSHRPAHCPHQMPAAIEAMVLEMRRSHPYWGGHRIAYELEKKGVEPAAVGVGSLSLHGPGSGHRPHQSPPAPGDLETMGASCANGALAAGRRARLPAG